MSHDTAILLFVKAPEKGHVKTRLAASLGDDAALELYSCFVEDIVDVVEKTGVPVRIHVHPSKAQSAVTRWLGPSRLYRPQQGHDLGQRMEHALRQAFTDGVSRAVLIGSDIPDLTPDILCEALDALRTTDSALGPAHDGGYYLVGFRKETFLPEVFHGIAWSTDSVYKSTIDLLRNAGRTIHYLPQLRDIDTVDDLIIFKQKWEAEPNSAVRTMRTLNRVLSR